MIIYQRSTEAQAESMAEGLPDQESRPGIHDRRSRARQLRISKAGTKFPKTSARPTRSGKKEWPRR